MSDGERGGVEATAREIVRALHAIPRLKIETPRCIGCQKPWTDDHNHDALHAEWPDDIIMLVKQEVYHYERDTEAEVALIADRLRAAPPSGLTPPPILAADPITGPSCPTCCAHDHSQPKALTPPREASGGASGPDSGRP